jgi:hypothetical protein
MGVLYRIFFSLILKWSGVGNCVPWLLRGESILFKLLAHIVDSVAGVAVVSRLIDGETQENRTINGRQVSPPLFSLEPAATPKPIFKKGMIRQLVLFL